MNTEHYFLIVFLSYMLLNVFSDLKAKRTSNYYHLVMLLLIACWGSVRGQIIELMIVGLASFMILLLYRQLPVIAFGSGDIKMLVITFMFWSVYLDSFVVITIFFLYIFISFAYETIYRMIKNVWKKEVEIAEAVPIFITSIIVLFISPL